jgi:hypothetical protein
MQAVRWCLITVYALVQSSGNQCGTGAGLFHEHLSHVLSLNMPPLINTPFTLRYTTTLISQHNVTSSVLSSDLISDLALAGLSVKKLITMHTYPYTSLCANYITILD